MQSTSSTIKLNVSSGILANADAEARRIGISLQDFIRMLMATYFANTQSVRAVSRDQSLYEQARNEIQSGSFVRVKNKRELNEYLNKLNS
ncbi:MAG: hypothetical protein AAB557_02640 [Patescibacteria group bacterium]